MALNLGLSYLNIHEWEVFLEASQAQKHRGEAGVSHCGAAGERKAALELGDEAEELRGTKGLCTIAACKGVSFVAAAQCVGGQVEQRLCQKPPLKVSP